MCPEKNYNFRSKDHNIDYLKLDLEGLGCVCVCDSNFPENYPISSCKIRSTKTAMNFASFLFSTF